MKDTADKNFITAEDYREPACPLCTDDPEKPKVVSIDCSRVIAKLDEYVFRNDYAAAKRHLKYWLAEAENGNDLRGKLTVLNETMGLARNMREEQEAFDAISEALSVSEQLGICGTVSYGTTLINAATAYKSFGRADLALPLYEKAKKIYEENLDPKDSQLGGLYNNMGLALTDAGKYSEAMESYEKAVAIMSSVEKGELEVAITYLNMTNLLAARDGSVNAEKEISDLLDKAEEILKNFPEKDGYYAYVCEKSAGTFDYYGRFGFAQDIKELSEKIYKENSENK